MLGFRWLGLAWFVVTACGGSTRSNHLEPDELATAGVTSGGATTRPQPTGEGGAGSGATSGGATSSGTAGVGAVAGSGGAPDPCADSLKGSERRCVTGEVVCDPVLGKLGTCDACGQPSDTTGDECVRGIASDKESNAICVLRGSDTLECWNGFTEPAGRPIGEDVAEVLLPDDYPYGTITEPCFRYAAGGFSCLAAAVGCEKVALGDSGLCAVCDGKLYCEGPITPPATAQDPIDISVTDSSVFVLGAAGVQFGVFAPQLPSDWRGEPRRLIVDHQFSGCMFSNLGEMACWLDLSKPPVTSSWSKPQLYTKVVGTTLPNACALDADRRLRCGDVLQDASPKALDATDIVDFVASANIVCALSAAGHVKCYDGSFAPIAVPSAWR